MRSRTYFCSTAKGRACRPYANGGVRDFSVAWGMTWTMASAVRRRCLDDSVTKCDRRCLEAGMHLQFREDVLDVGADRMPTDRETGRDLVARSPSRQQREDLAFTPSQYLDRSSLAARRARIGLYERLRSYELPIDDTLDGSDEGGPREGLHDVAHKPQLERSCDDSRILVGC